MTVFCKDKIKFFIFINIKIKNLFDYLLNITYFLRIKIHELCIIITIRARHLFIDFNQLHVFFIRIS